MIFYVPTKGLLTMLASPVVVKSLVGHGIIFHPLVIVHTGISQENKIWIFFITA